MSACPRCQGAGHVTRHNSMSGMPRLSARCDRCYGTGTLASPPACDDLDAIRAADMTARGYRPNIGSPGRSIYPGTNRRAFLGWTKQEAAS